MTSTDVFYHALLARAAYANLTGEETNFAELTDTSGQSAMTDSMVSYVKSVYDDVR